MVALPFGIFPAFHLCAGDSPGKISAEISNMVLIYVFTSAWIYKIWFDALLL